MKEISVARANIHTPDPAVRVEDAEGKRLVHSISIHGSSWIGQRNSRVLLLTGSPITEHDKAGMPMEVYLDLEQEDFGGQPNTHPVQLRVTSKEVYDLETGDLIATIPNGKYRFYWAHNHLHVGPEGWVVEKENSVAREADKVVDHPPSKPMVCPDCKQETLKIKLDSTKNHARHLVCRCGFDDINQGIIVIYEKDGRFPSKNGRFSIIGRRNYNSHTDGDYKTV